MPLFDLSGHALTGYRSDVTPPSNLQAFWDETIAQARAAGWEPKVERVETGLRLVDTYDVTFSGFGGDPIRAWYHRPAGTDADLPIVVRYQGYGGGRGHPHQTGIWPLAGYACLEMDTRGQGSGWAPGDTPDPAGSLPAYPGYLTRGILDPQTYYYRRLFTDGVRAVDCARTLPGADAGRVCVTGKSQGGGIGLAVAGLVGDLTAVMPDVAFCRTFAEPPSSPLRTRTWSWLAISPCTVATSSRSSPLSPTSTCRCSLAPLRRPRCSPWG